MFALASLLGAVPGKVWAVSIGGVIVVAAALYVVARIYSAGEDHAMVKIEEANHASERKADAAVDPVNACYDRNGWSWDRARGVCVSPAARSGH